MNALKKYRTIIDFAVKHLFASVPRQYVERFREHAFFDNISRFSIQSTVVVFMNVGYLIVYLLNRTSLGIFEPFVITLLVCIVLFSVLSYVFADMSNKPYNSKNVLYRRIDVLYPILHAVCETALFVASPQDLAALIRLLAGPFIVGGVPIMKQVKSFVILFGFYLLIFLGVPHTAYEPYVSSYVFPYIFWFVVFSCSMFISATVYSWFVNNFVAITAYEEANSEFVTLNEKLSQAVRHRTELLDVMNEITAELLDSDTDGFDAVFLSSMEKIGNAVDVDRVYMWKNHMENNELYCTQTHEWSGGAEAQQGTELTLSVPFPPDWYPKLSTNKCVNGIVREFPDFERSHLEAQGIISIIVVPVFLHEEFWGFVGFDDCHTERVFSEMEESILRSIALLFATSMLRNEITIKLMEATKDALTSSKAKTDFLANMSHEIRTPINAITGMSGMIRQAQNKSEVFYCLDRIDTASRQLLSIINDILDMSKIDAGKIELSEDAFRLSMMLNNVYSIVGGQATGKGLEFTKDFDSNLPDVLVGDEMRLTQVLLNLLSNAIKFTPNGGSVHLSARQKSIRDDGFAELEFLVKDTGIGISDEQRESLFKKFEQADRSISRRFGGTGLGLAITKKLVEMMDGTVELVSTPEKGSTFSVTVFIKRGDASMLKKNDILEGTIDTDFASFHALLVEDIEVNREIVIAMLEHTGLQIDEAVDGQQAFDMFSAAPDRYDIIFMDLHMPVKDGYSATVEIRALDHPNAKIVPIIAMTANAFKEDIDRCLKTGMNDHIAKPVDYKDVIKKISKYLKKEK